MSQSVTQVDIIKVSAAESKGSDLLSRGGQPDYLAVEEPLEIRLNFGKAGDRKTRSISITMRTPGNDEELAAGFLFTEGIISGGGEVSSIAHLNSLLNPENIVIVDLDERVEPDLIKLERNFYTTSSCGVCGKASIEAVKTTGNLQNVAGTELEVKTEVFKALPERLRSRQEVFDTTGGLHASALFDREGGFLMSREDVGRHNALDKLIGWALNEKRIPLDSEILLLSGRASFELIQKAAMARIKIVAAVGAPSSLAVQTAKEFGMTLIGFLRENRFNIYCGEERVIW